MVKIGFLWPGLPDYAARCIRAVIERSPYSITVVATQPNVPIEGMEHSLGRSVIWVEASDDTVTWSQFAESPPDILFCGGYSVSAFNALAREVRDFGGSVVLMSDNNGREGFHCRLIEMVRHRLFYKRNFQGIFVPGASAAKVAKEWGYETYLTEQCLYGADPALFKGGDALNSRPKHFLFVGQFIDRKNVLKLVEAFINFCNIHPDWTLGLCGSGPRLRDIPAHQRISIHGFVQPLQLAEMLRQTRCLILPSETEHWGLVVHEATLSGCALALSKRVGAAEDLAHPCNSVLFNPKEVTDITHSMCKIAEWSDAQWRQAEDTSRRLATFFGPEPFSNSVNSIVAKISGSSFN